MYPNLRAEMARKGVSVMELCRRTGLTYNQLYPRLSKSGHERKQGFADMPISWAFRIKKALDLDLTIDYLFEMEQ